jgi:hypothetical protein
MTERSPGRGAHLELGAYVLDGLEPAERAAFERHLAGCADCRAELVELEVLPPLLGRVPLTAILADPELGGLLEEDLTTAPPPIAPGQPAWHRPPADRSATSPRVPARPPRGSPADGSPADGSPVRGWRPDVTGATAGRADGTLVDGPASVRPARAARRVATARRVAATRRFPPPGRWYLAAALGALVLVLGAALALTAVMTGRSGGGEVTFALAAPSTSAGGTGVAGSPGAPSGTAHLRASGSGSTLTVDVTGISPGTECAVLLTGPDGRTVRVTTWTASYRGAGSATAKTAIAPAGVRAVAVRDAATNGTLLSGAPA